jgi:hypothetical protein
MCFLLREGHPSWREIDAPSRGRLTGVRLDAEWNFPEKGLWIPGRRRAGEIAGRARG